jgi:hypothetical protein
MSPGEHFGSAALIRLVERLLAMDNEAEGVSIVLRKRDWNSVVSSQCVADRHSLSAPVWNVLSSL